MLVLNIFQKEDEWAQELAQPLRVLAALDEDLASIPSTHMSAHKLYLQSWASDTSSDLCGHQAYTYVEAKHSNI